MSQQSSERKRRQRARERKGLLSVRVEVPLDVIAAAMERGDLPESETPEAADREALSHLVVRGLRLVAARANIVTS